jgi:hypothetical protein
MLKTFAAVRIAASMLPAPALAQSTTPAPSAPATQATKAPAVKVVKAKKHHKVKKHVRARVACEARASRPPWPPSRAACVEADACGAHDP